MKILLIEDHIGTRTALMLLLRELKYEVVGVATGAEAEEQISAHRFDLVISDIGLPDISGWELLPRLRARQPWLMALAVSASGSTEDVAASSAAGFSMHLSKPVSVERLHSAIRSVSENPSG